MRRLAITYRRVLAFGLVIVPGIASAVDDAEADESVVHGFIVNVVPLLLILVVFGLLLKAHNKRYGQYMERSRQHMDKLEDNTARIVTELEEIRKEIKRKSP